MVIQLVTFGGRKLNASNINLKKVFVVYVYFLSMVLFDEHIYRAVTVSQNQLKLLQSSAVSFSTLSTFSVLKIFHASEAHHHRLYNYILSTIMQEDGWYFICQTKHIQTILNAKCLCTLVSL